VHGAASDVYASGTSSAPHAANLLRRQLQLLRSPHLAGAVLDEVDRPRLRLPGKVGCWRPAFGAAGRARRSEPRLLDGGSGSIESPAVPLSSALNLWPTGERPKAGEALTAAGAGDARPERAGRAEPHPHLEERWPGGAARASRPNPGWPARPRPDAHADHAAAALLGERRGRGTPVTYRGATAATMSGSFTQRNCTHAASAPVEDERAEPVRRFSLGTLAPAGSAPPEKASASLAPPPVREQLPIALRRLHPDGGSEFINWQLCAFCQANQIALMQILAEAGVNLRVTIDRSQGRSDIGKTTGHSRAGRPSYGFPDGPRSSVGDPALFVSCRPTGRFTPVFRRPVLEPAPKKRTSPMKKR